MELKHVLLDTVVQTSEKNSMFVTAYEYLNIDIFFRKTTATPELLLPRNKFTSNYKEEDPLKDL